MEPANLNRPTSPEDDDRLDALLRAPRAELPDDGFSARVVAALPPRLPVAALRISRRATACAVVGIAVAIGFGQPWTGWAAGWRERAAALDSAGRHLAESAMAAALAAAAVSAGYAYWDGLRRRLAVFF